MLALNNNFKLVSVESKVVGKTYKPHLRALEIKYTQALNRDYINELAICNNQKVLSKAPSYLAALSINPILSFNDSNKSIEDIKTLLKFVFKVKTGNKNIERYFVLNGYCKASIDLHKVSKEINFIPTYSFEYQTNLDGSTVFGDRIDYVSFPKFTGKVPELVISRPGDTLSGIHTLKVMDSDVFSYSQYNPFIRRERVLVNRENINPVAYLNNLFKLSNYPMCDLENDFTSVHDKVSLYASMLNEKEPLCLPSKFPFDLTGLILNQNADIPLSDIINSFPNFFKLLTVIKEPVIDYTLTTEKFGKSVLSESLSQELILNTLEAISKVGLESIHIKGSNMDNDSEDVITFNFVKGVSERSKFNDTPIQIKSVCNQLKNQIFTKLIGSVPKDKIGITFDLYVTSFGISILNVQFPTEVGIRRKIYSYAYPTYEPASWSPLVTTVQEAGPLAQRVYEQLRSLNIYI